MRSVDEGLAEALRWHLAPFRRPEQASKFVNIDVVPSEPREDDPDDTPRFAYLRAYEQRFRGPLAGVLIWTLWDVHSLVPKVARDFLFLHAGAVARSGGALILPARMDTGKSTLTAALLTHGFDYLSDEMAALDPVTARNYPFPKLISLDASSLEMLPGVEERLDDRRGLSAELTDRYLRAENLGARGGGASPVRWIVFPTPNREGPPRLESVTSARAVEMMAANCFNLARFEERGAILLARAARDAEAYTLSGGTATERAALLAERFG